MIALGLLEDLWQCVPYLHFNYTNYPLNQCASSGPCPMLSPSTEFCENRLSSFYVIMNLLFELVAVGTPMGGSWPKFYGVF